ncbi:histone-lysine N-methyltransferase SETMAR-like [Galleria mellonella]|uniref:Histone-lysine N-methyltransferase SETMAR-like n=1 Tax=Galleria mellonella TaxID=7137 RepID=A0A6J1WXH0_GALME|nr:histone-lysine N-methyltransferase SETMAR-like [Galleria mellonella]
MELSRKDFRAMIFYDFKSSLSPQDCAARLQNAFGREAPCLSTVRRWYAEFERSRVSLHGEFREGRPPTAVNENNVATVKRLIEENPQIIYEAIRELLRISMSQIQKILHEELRVRKLCCRWIPHELTAEQKRARVEWCLQMLLQYDHGHYNAVYDIVTGDETWIYYFEPEEKQQSCVWVFENENRPTKVKQARNVGKKMITFFFSATDPICTIPLEDQKSINAEWYFTICLPRVLEKVRERRPKSRILLHHDNASSHTANKTKSFLASEKVQLVTHPAYSPNLVSCDFCFFPKIKDLMRGFTFTNSEEAVIVFNQHVENMPSDLWSSCFKKWFDRMKKCLKCKEEYFGKQ